MSDVSLKEYIKWYNLSEICLHFFSSQVEYNLFFKHPLVDILCYPMHRFVYCLENSHLPREIISLLQTDNLLILDLAWVWYNPDQKNYILD